jgi:hypothetical protein
MKIKNINLKTIEARRYTNLDERPKQIRIDHNSSFTHISYIKENETSVDFQYTASYGAVGVIKIEGQLIYENNDAKDISKEWNDKRKIPDEVASHLHTAIMHACVPEAVGIAKDLALPPPIPLPQVSLGNKPTKVASGQEVA